MAATLLVERHSQALARFAVSCGARDEVEELVQDTFVRAFGSLESFRGDSSFAWLFTIERRLLLDRHRAEKRRPKSTEIMEDDAATEYDALDQMIGEEAGARLRGAIDDLTPTQRGEVFVLRVTEGMSYREIADTVGTTEGAARVHYHNAMRAIKELLDA